MLNYVNWGDKLIKEFRKNEIVLKKKMLFDKNAKKVIKIDSNQDQLTKDLKKESMILLWSVDVTRTR